MGQKRQFSLRTMLAGIAVIALLLSCGYRMIGPAMPRSLLRQIKRGMNKEEVRQILGAPHEIASDHEWQYSRIGNVGWVEVWFDKHGRVTEINDESAFP